MIGRYLDEEASDAEKDRVIRATKWCTKAWSDDEGGKCLVAHLVARDIATNRPKDRGAHIRVTGCSYNGEVLYGRFDKLCLRFGMDRIVRLIKHRAAATLSSEVEQEREFVTH